MADAIFACLRQDDALLGHLLAEKAVGNLHENARAVAHQRIGTDGTAMRQVLENEQAVAHDLVRLLALHMCDEADAAGVMFVARIVKALFRRDAHRFRTIGAFRRFGRRGSIGCSGLVKTRERLPVRHRLPSDKARLAGAPSSRAVRFRRRRATALLHCEDPAANHGPDVEPVVSVRALLFHRRIARRPKGLKGHARGNYSSKSRHRQGPLAHLRPRRPK